MLVFGRLKCRKLQIPSIKNNAKDDATGVIYIPWVCIGATLPLHTSAGYIHAAWVSLCLSILNGFSYNHKRRTGEGADAHVFCMWL